MMKMSEKMVIDKLVKALRCCERYNCIGCPFTTVHECSGKMIKQAADTLESLTAERDGLKEQLAAALSENTKLAERQAAPENEESPEAITQAMREIKDTHCGDYDCLLPDNKLDDSGYWANDDLCKDCTYGVCYRALERSLPEAGEKG